MHTVRLISERVTNVEPLPCEPVEGACCLLGSVEQCIPKRHLLGQSFTNIDRLARPNSDMISVVAWRAFRAFRVNDKGKHTYPERMSCWMIEGDEFVPMLASDIVAKKKFRDLALNGSTKSPWALYLTTKYQKHGSLFTIPNSPGPGFVTLDTTPVYCGDPALTKQVWDVLLDARRRGLPRPVIENLDPNGRTIQNFGISEWATFKAWAEPRRRQPLYKLMVYLLPTQEELDLCDD